jgi:hypothetical protein
MILHEDCVLPVTIYDNILLTRGPLFVALVRAVRLARPPG